MEKRFCPNCGSDWVEPDTSNRWATATFGGNPNQWRCKDCKYSGLMPSGEPEEDENTLEFQPREKYNRIDMEATPRFVISFLAILLISSLLYLIYLRV